MDFAFDSVTTQWRDRLELFMDEHVYPNEVLFSTQVEEQADRWAWSRTPILRDLQARARQQGLWNLFMPGERGAGLTNLQYAPLAEITGRSAALAPAVFNCAAPDTGNMEVLAIAGDSAQQ